jgi:hypothetical protein
MKGIYENDPLVQMCYMQDSASAGLQRMGMSTTRQKKSSLGLKRLSFDHKIGLICSNLIEKSHPSSNPGQNPVHLHTKYPTSHMSWCFFT